MARAAAAAASRGAVADAAELAGHELRLTPVGDSEYDERLLALARYLTDAGEHPRAAGLLAGRIETLPAPVAVPRDQIPYQRAVAHLRERLDLVAGGSFDRDANISPIIALINH